jgi:hypothetical protein
VCGNAFAAAIDRQKTLISRIRNEACAGETFSSAAIFSAPTVPASPENTIREQGSKQNVYTQIKREQKSKGVEIQTTSIKIPKIENAYH